MRHRWLISRLFEGPCRLVLFNSPWIPSSQTTEPLKLKAIGSFEMPAAICPAAERHVTSRHSTPLWKRRKSVADDVFDLMSKKL